jgi:multidrug efflux pump
MQKSTARIVSIAKADPAVANAMAFTGGGGPTNGGFIYVGLKPLEERNANASQVIDRLRPKLFAVPAPTPLCRPDRISASADV